MRGIWVFGSNFGDKLSQRRFCSKEPETYESEVGLRTWLTQGGARNDAAEIRLQSSPLRSDQQSRTQLTS